jgi:hypothetical protein
MPAGSFLTTFCLFWPELTDFGTERVCAGRAEHAQPADFALAST